MEKNYVKASILSICIIFFIPTVVFAAGFRYYLGMTLGAAGGFVGLILGWIIFPYTLSFIDVIGKSPINMFLSRLGGAATGALIGFTLVFYLIAGEPESAQPKTIPNSTQTAIQNTQEKNTSDVNSAENSPGAASNTEQGETEEANNVELSNTAEPQMESTNIDGASHGDNTLLNEQIVNAYVGYVHAMIDAINGGDFSQVSSFLLEGSPLWDSQIALVNNLVQKEIKEKVVEAHVVNIDWLSDNDMELKTKETITIRYPSGKSNTKAYYWKYKATYLNGNILFSDIAKWSM